MRKYDNDILFTPGPTNIPPRVLAAGVYPSFHHRTPEFSNILNSVMVRMKQLFITSGDVLLVHTSGRGAIEGCIRNLFSVGDKILSICSGKFGKMMAEIGEVNGLQVEKIFSSWEEPIDYSVIDRKLAEDNKIKAVTITHCDTSTGVINDIKVIGEIIRKHNRILIVDCISSLGCLEFRFDDWNVDVAITSSQKGLMSSTGISFVAINERAWELTAKSTMSHYYINFKDIKDKFHSSKETPGSTPVSLIVSVNESLNMIFEEGIENVWRRHEIISIAIKESMKTLGFKIFPQSDVLRSHSLTVLQNPEGINSQDIINIVKNKYGILIASGLGEKYKENVIRIGHMGSITVRDALLLVSTMECVLYELGCTKNIGKGIETFLQNI